MQTLSEKLQKKKTIGSLEQQETALASKARVLSKRSQKKTKLELMVRINA
jgi:hypothetical protein